VLKSFYTLIESERLGTRLTAINKATITPKPTALIAASRDGYH